MNEFLGGGVLGNQELHDLLEVVHALDELVSFLFALVEHGSDLGVSGGLRIPFDDKNGRVSDDLTNHRVREANAGARVTARGRE